MSLRSPILDQDSSPIIRGSHYHLGHIANIHVVRWRSVFTEAQSRRPLLMSTSRSQNHRKLPLPLYRREGHREIWQTIELQRFVQLILPSSYSIWAETQALVSIGSSRGSWSKGATLQLAMGLVESQSTERSSRTRTSSLSTPSHSCFRWQTLDQVGLFSAFSCLGLELMCR